MLGRVDRVTSVANVASDFNAEISTNSSHSTFGRHGGTEHLASLQNNVLSFPNHSTDRSGCHVRNKTREELLALQVSVVVFHMFLAGLGELHGNKLVTLLFETLDDFTNESTLDAIGLCVRR